MNAIFKLNPRTEPTLEDLAIEWLAAKAAESVAIEHRRAIDTLIVQRMTNEAGEGTVSDKFAKVKVAVTYKIDRKVDSDKLGLDWRNLSDKAQAAFRWKADLDTKVMRAAQDMAPEVYSTICQYITAKPASPSVKVEEVA